MHVPSLFVGVVSHDGSRFAVSQGPLGLAARLSETLSGVAVQVNTRNLLPADSPLVSTLTVQEALSAELALDRTWARYLGRRMNARWWGVHAARGVRRAWQRLRPPSPSMVRRLLNIELSHIDLMRQGLSSGAPWVLIVEDDGVTSDISDLSDGLQALIHSPEPPSFVNLSESFTTQALGIDHLLSPVQQVTWAGSVPRLVMQASRPVTNTVCAILYSAPFLSELVQAMDSLPMEPVVPIDWKLNMALMALYEGGRVPSGTCWLVEPAPIRQMSMQPAGILAQ